MLIRLTQLGQYNRHEINLQFTNKEKQIFIKYVRFRFVFPNARENSAPQNAITFDSVLAWVSLYLHIVVCFSFVFRLLMSLPYLSCMCAPLLHVFGGDRCCCYFFISIFLPWCDRVRSTRVVFIPSMAGSVLVSLGGKILRIW